MATGAAERMGSDYALAVTGFNGACGGKTTENPAGTIFIALYSPQGVWSKRLSFPGPRSAVQARSVNAALDWLRRELLRASRGSAAPMRQTEAM
jgi:nicotinamide-nucleotide amidase